MFLLLGVGTIFGVERRARAGLNERIRAEQELRKAHDYNHAAFGAPDEGMYGVDRQGCCTFVNPEGERLQDVIREPDILARQGGDEFIVLLTRLRGDESSEPPSSEAITREAVQVAERLLGALKRPLEVPGQEFFAGASIGISVYPQDAEEPVVLLEHADSAVYQAKHPGGRLLYPVRSRTVPGHGTPASPRDPAA